MCKYIINNRMCYSSPGFLLTILYWSPVLNDPDISAAYQNFLITIEMLFAAILLRFAFPYKPYMERRKDRLGRGVPVKKVADNFKNTLNPGVCAELEIVTQICSVNLSEHSKSCSAIARFLSESSNGQM